MKSNRFLIGLLLTLFIAFVACSPPPPVMEESSEEPSEEQILERARTLHEEALTLDTHVDIGSNYATAEMDPGTNTESKVDLVKMEAGQMDGVFLAVFVGQTPELNAAGYEKAKEQAMAKFDAVHRLTDEMYPDRCALATTPDEVEQIAATGKRVIMLGIENGYVIGEDLSLVQTYYDLGTRYITLSHSGHNQICDSSSPAEPMHDGMSEFGKEVVAEMNRLGIMVDVSHISVKSYSDLMEVTKAPVIASHSGCWNLNPVNRNLNDDQLRALTANGGVIQVVALGSFLKGASPEETQATEALAKELGLSMDERGRVDTSDATDEIRQKVREGSREIRQKYPRATITDYVDHIDHAVEVSGIDHVGIGTDFDGGGGIPGFNDASEALNVTTELVRRGYSDEDIKKIWGENLLRVWREVERIAAES